jgi:hypothetical protein
MKVYKKYHIEKEDGTACDPNAVYFVLRIDKDLAAREALKAYAMAVRGSDYEFFESILQYLDDTPITLDKFQ